MDNLNFNEFEAASEEKWRQQILKDFKAENWKTISYKAEPGLTIKPFYAAGDLPQLEFPKAEGSTGRISIKIDCDGKEKAKKALKKKDLKGVKNICFISFSDAFGASLPKKARKKTAYYDCQNLSPEFVEKVIVSKKKKTKSFLLYDIINKPVQSGNWQVSRAADFELLQQIVHRAPRFCMLNIKAIHYHNAGAGMVLQLALALAHANEYLNYFQNSKNILQSGSGFLFQMGLSSNFFINLAGFQTLRYLWHLIAGQHECKIPITVWAEPGITNKSAIDYNTNLLRTTTELTSAFAGDADGIFNLPYDALLKGKSDFAQRLALNQMRILKEESCLNTISNASQGSYYIESLSAQMVAETLKLFKQIEKEGGFLKLLESGNIQQMVAKEAEILKQRTNSGEQILVGINKYSLQEKTMESAALPLKNGKNDRFWCQPLHLLNLETELKKEHAPQN